MNRRRLGRANEARWKETVHAVVASSFPLLDRHLRPSITHVVG